MFDVSIGRISSGPDVKLFVHFKNHWSFTDATQLDTGLDDPGALQILSQSQATADEVVAFCKTLLKTHLPRDDYMEYLELVLMLLGETSERGLHFMQPEAHHHARWRANIIIPLMIWMFK